MTTSASRVLAAAVACMCFSAAAAAYLAAPSIQPRPNGYTQVKGAFALVLASGEDEDVTFHYTTDGRLPTRDSPSHHSGTGALRLPEVSLGRLDFSVIATKDGFEDSDPANITLNVVESSYQWRVNGVPVEGGSCSELDMRFTEDSVVDCIITNALGAVTTDPVSVTVRPMQSSFAQPLPAQVELQQSHTLELNATALGLGAGLRFPVPCE